MTRECLANQERKEKMGGGRRGRPWPLTVCRSYELVLLMSTAAIVPLRDRYAGVNERFEELITEFLGLRFTVYVRDFVCRRCLCAQRRSVQ